MIICVTLQIQTNCDSQPATAREIGQHQHQFSRESNNIPLQSSDRKISFLGRGSPLRWGNRGRGGWKSLVTGWEILCWGMLRGQLAGLSSNIDSLMTDPCNNIIGTPAYIISQTARSHSHLLPPPDIFHVIWRNYCSQSQPSQHAQHSLANDSVWQKQWMEWISPCLVPHFPWLNWKKNRQSQNCPPTTHQVGVRWITECFVQELEDLRSEGEEARRQSQTQYDEVGEVLGKYKN